MPNITPYLWFDNNAEEAANFYLSVFPNSRRTSELRAGDAGPGPKGAIVTISFELDGKPFTALNGGPGEAFNNSISFFVHCKDQEEIDHYWSKLLEGGGSEIACGWLKDRFGVRWQIVPVNIMELIRPAAAMRAMMQMKKLDIAELERAAQS